jgi:hypothetical protein
MARTVRQLVLEHDHDVELTLRIPASLYRTLHSYCVFRDADGDKLPLAAIGAMRSYFAENVPFQTWLREHPDLPVTLPSGPVQRRGRALKSRPGLSETGA